MKIAVMQPYLFPYIGYFQLISAVETFILRDDVQYIKQGWINRNSILVNGEKSMFQFALKKDHQKTPIKDRIIAQKFFSIECDNFKKTLNCAYKKAPMYSTASEVIFDILDNMKESLTDSIEYSIRRLCNYFGIDTKVIVSSKMGWEFELKKEEALYEICHVMNADHYINAIGGQILYSKEAFQEQGIKLNFIQTRPLEYKQFANEFIPNLSIIDVMMFNSKEIIKEMLKEFDLV